MVADLHAEHMSVLCSQEHQTVNHSSTLVLRLYTFCIDLAELLESQWHLPCIVLKTSSRCSENKQTLLWKQAAVKTLHQMLCLQTG